MPMKIFANTEPMPERRAALSSAVIDGSSQWTGNFEAKITADPARSGIRIEIEGEGRHWVRDFDGPVELRQDFIRKAVEQAWF